MEIIFATNNQHKVAEIAALLPPSIKMVSLKEAGITVDILEPYDTLHQNAEEKASVVYSLTGLPCFSEDSGLEVAALKGQPGVRSARYAGEEATAAQNITKLLKELNGAVDRSAQFRTVICFMDGMNKHYFEGLCRGRIIVEESGTSGFGYDPVFIPDGAEKTFARMTLAEKNVYSHRRKAVDGLVNFLKQALIN